MDPDPRDDRPPGFWRTRFAFGWVVLATVAGWFLWTEHRAHLLGVLPYLILLACPLMHAFMHRRHRHGSHHEPGTHGERSSAPPGPPGPVNGDR